MGSPSRQVLASWVVHWARVYCFFLFICIIPEQHLILSGHRHSLKSFTAVHPGHRSCFLSPWLFCKWLSSTSGFLRVLAELFKAVIAPPLDIWEGYPSVGLASACVCVGPSWWWCPWPEALPGLAWFSCIHPVTPPRECCGFLSEQIHIQHVPAPRNSAESLQTRVAHFCVSWDAPVKSHTGSVRADGSWCGTEGLVTTFLV